MPIYYRTFRGNIPGSRTVDVVLKDLDDAGFCGNLTINPNSLPRSGDGQGNRKRDSRYK